MKTERIQQLKKAFTLYRRGGYGFAYRWNLYFIRDIQKKKLPNNFKIRVMDCDCGLHIDRDQNAAINIRNEGLRLLSEVA